MSFLCKNCDRTFVYEYLLLRHNKRKRPCKKKIEIDQIIDNTNIEERIKKLEENIDRIFTESLNDELICKYCNKKFDFKGNLKRHMNISCSERKKLYKEKEELYKEKEELYKEKEIIKKYINNTINNTNNANNANNANKTINNNINANVNSSVNSNNKNLSININNIIHPFGKEDISYITESEYKKILSTFFPGFVEFVKTVHFDNRMPSNHNVYISNIDSKYACVYEDNQWNLKKKADIVDKIITTKRKLLNNKCNELYNTGVIDDDVVDLHGEFNKNYYSGGKGSEKFLSDDIELLLYNYKNKIKTIN